MEQLNLTSLEELEKLNATELGSIKGGVINSKTIDKNPSEHHDSDNNDTFKEDHI